MAYSRDRGCLLYPRSLWRRHYRARAGGDGLHAPGGCTATPGTRNPRPGDLLPARKSSEANRYDLPSAEARDLSDAAHTHIRNLWPYLGVFRADGAGRTPRPPSVTTSQERGMS